MGLCISSLFELALFIKELWWIRTKCLCQSFPSTDPSEPNKLMVWELLLLFAKQHWIDLLNSVTQTCLIAMSKKHTFQRPLETSKCAFPVFEDETRKQYCCLLNLLILVFIQTCKDQSSDMQKNRIHLFSNFSSQLCVIHKDKSLNAIVYWRCFSIVLICCVTGSYLHGDLSTPLNEIQMDIKHRYNVFLYPVYVWFDFFNSKWLIADEIELASGLVGVISVTLQIIPSKKKPEVQTLHLHRALLTTRAGLPISSLLLKYWKTKSICSLVLAGWLNSGQDKSVCLFFNPAYNDFKCFHSQHLL